jgi:hypothetical protein
MPVLKGTVTEGQLDLIRGWAEESPAKVVKGPQATPSGEKGTYAKPYVVTITVKDLDPEDYITLNSCGLREKA